MRSAPLLVVVVAFAFVAGCPGGPPPPPPDTRPLELTVALAPDAPAADPNDAPDVTGLLPDGVPDGVQVFDLGAVGIKDGESGDILVDVASGLGALTVLVYGQPENTVILSRAVDPDGNLVVSDVDPDPAPSAAVLNYARGFPAQAFSVNRVFGSLGSGAFLVPNTPSVAARSGRWKLRVGNASVDLNASTPVRTPVDRPVHVVVLATGRGTGKGRIDLNLHFTGAGGLSAATAPTDALLQGALDVMREAYANAHVDLGEVRYLDIDPQFQEIALSRERCDGGDLDRVVAQGAGDEPGIDLFFVDHFSCFVGQDPVDVGSSIGGIAAGLPGPPFVHGTTHAGVAVSTSFSTDAHPLGVVMAHETGHFLGLYHTRESGGAVFDEIDDTPNDSGAVDNLMYFANQDDTTLTEGQAHVLRSNPFVIPE